MQSSNMQRNERDEGGTSWPVVDGSYSVGDPTAPIAVCALTSDELIQPLATVPGVAIAGQVQTANLGIERIILNVTANPSIRFLFLCGKESRLFRPGQTLGALFDNGIDLEGHVVGSSSEALFRVKAVSLNHGEVRTVTSVNNPSAGGPKAPHSALPHPRPYKPIFPFR